MSVEICAPVFVPLTADQELNLTVIKDYYRYLKDNGVNSIMVNGGCGEYVSLTLQERKMVLESWYDCIKEVDDSSFKIIVNIGSCCVKDVIELAKHAMKYECVKELAITPPFYTPITNEFTLLNYIQYVYDQLDKKIGLLYYHIPSKTRIDISLEKLITVIKQTNYQAISSIKFTDCNIDELATLRLAVQNTMIKLYCGFDALIDKVEPMDLYGVILAEVNVYPNELTKVFSKMDTKQKQSSLEKLKTNFNAVLDFSAQHQVDLIALFKLLCEKQSKLKLGPMRRPYDLGHGTVDLFTAYINKELR